MNLSLLLSALRARSRVFYWVLATTVIATLIVSLIVPKTYVAKTSLLVDGKSEQSMSNSAPMPDRERAGFLQTQVDILTSPAVARRVVNDLRLANDPELTAAFEASEQSGTFADWLGEKLLKTVKVDATQSSIIRVAVSADNPHFAAQIANGFGKAYMDSVLDLRVEPLKKTSAWFDEQLKGLRDNMDQSERRLAEFQKQNGILSVDERYDLENIHLTDLAGRASRTRASSLPAKALDSETELGATPENLPSIQENRNIQNLKASLVIAESKLQQISSEFGSRHPLVIRQTAEVQALREQMNKEVKTAVSGAQQVAQTERQRRQRLQAELAAQRERVGDLRQARNRLAVLSNDFAIAQRTYDTAMQRSIISKIDSRAQLSNVSVLNEAIPPPKPERPNIPLNIALAVVIGALMGLTVVHLLELSDHRVRLIDDLDGDPRMPLLAVLNSSDPAPNRLIANSSSLKALPGPGWIQA